MYICIQKESTMIETQKAYPAYVQENQDIRSRSVCITLQYDQALELANVLYLLFSRERRPRLFGGFRFSSVIAQMHATLHNTFFNVCNLIEQSHKDHVSKES
jgi:hypothetical protein